jgi:hypothetical protein
MKGLDLSFSEAPDTWWRRRYAEGFRVGVQDLWTGGSTSEGLRHVAPRNLRRAREAGFIVCGYTNVAPWNTGDVAFEKAVEFAEDEWQHLYAVFVDVEIKAHTGRSIREADIRRCLERIEAAGKKTAIYSAPWFWVGHLGNPRWSWLKQYRIWNAYYDGDPDTDFATAPWGPWMSDDVIGEQYQGSTEIEGVSVDLNEFREEFFASVLRRREVDMPKLIRPRGRPEVYQVNGGSLEHIPDRQTFDRLDYRLADVEQVEKDDSLLALPVTYKGGVPQELR